MSAKILDGRATRDRILEALAKKLSTQKQKPTLAIISIGDDPASAVYVREKEKAAERIGINFRLIKKSADIKQSELEKIVDELSHDSQVNGIVVQKPLPEHIDETKIDWSIAPTKDVDGLNPASDFYPTTARGVLKLLNEYNIEIAGKDVVVVGRSKLSGLPTALLLLDEDATVTICHSKTSDLKFKTLQADILVAAVGVPKLVTADMVKAKAVVVDVGTNRVKGANKLVGDVDFENVKNIASFISPVPGGVGPMIVAGLMMNLVEASDN